VAVSDQTDAGPRRADIVDQLRVAVAIEHDDDEVLDVPLEASRDRAKVLGNRRVQAHRVLRGWTHDQLLHVEIWSVKETAFVRRGQHGNRVRRAGRAQVRAFQRIDGDVDLRKGDALPFRLVRQADLLADVEHRRLVAFTFTDDDGAVDRY